MLFNLVLGVIGAFLGAALLKKPGGAVVGFAVGCLAAMMFRMKRRMGDLERRIAAVESPGDGRRSPKESSSPGELTATGTAVVPPEISGGMAGHVADSRSAAAAGKPSREGYAPRKPGCARRRAPGERRKGGPGGGRPHRMRRPGHPSPSVGRERSKPFSPRETWWCASGSLSCFSAWRFS